MTKRDRIREAKDDYYHAVTMLKQTQRELRFVRGAVQKLKHNKKMARRKLRELGLTRKEVKRLAKKWLNELKRR